MFDIRQASEAQVRTVQLGKESKKGAESIGLAPSHPIQWGQQGQQTDENSSALTDGWS